MRLRATEEDYDEEPICMPIFSLLEARKPKPAVPQVAPAGDDDIPF